MAVISAQSCPTSNNMLHAVREVIWSWMCYCNIKEAYKVRNLPPVGKSDHHNLLLMPTYKQELKQTAVCETH